ncbi:MAG: DUF4040 domain-containing protein [Spirochaetales bacterium]|nr:DUF4040 domain-containing protein [Spirochaetales bacterium]
MINIFMIIIMISMIIAAIKAITAVKLLDSIFFFSFIGIGATILFAIMKAPDVALTEAAVGTGLITLVFLSTLRKTSKEDEHES